MITADEYLQHTYGQGVEAIDEIVVVTKGSCYTINQDHGKSETPVFWPFEQGEILFLGPSGREPFGEGRKPGKWDIEVVSVRTLEEAVELSKHIKSQPAVFMPDYKLEWTPEERKAWDV